MTRKCHNHRKEETWRTDSHITARTQLKQINQLSLPQGDDCNTRNDTKHFITKQGPNTK